MKTFRSLAVVRLPAEDVLGIVRDRLLDLVPMVDDVDDIETLSREDVGHGRVRLVNRWTASQRLPDAVAKTLKTTDIAWIDRNEWDASAMQCQWSIEPLVLTEHITCTGVTTYEPAMGGRGCRVTLSGTFDLAPAALDRFSGALRRPVTSLVESVVSTIIPRGTRKVVEAAATIGASER